jgi:hypothetical protein
VAIVAVVVGFLALVARAIYPSLDWLWAYAGTLGEWVLLVFLVLTTVFSAVLINIGQRCVHSVAQGIHENINHLARRYVEENKAAAQGMLAFTNELAQQRL